MPKEAEGRFPDPQGDDKLLAGQTWKQMPGLEARGFSELCGLSELSVCHSASILYMYLHPASDPWAFRNH